MTDRVYTPVNPSSIAPGEILVSLFHLPKQRGAATIIEQALTLTQVQELIRSDTDLQANTAFVRPLKAADREKYDRLKKGMAHIVPASNAGEGTALAKLPIEHHNGLYGYDLDKGDINAPALVELIKQAPGAVLVARSVGGDLWCIFAGPRATGPKNYKACWAAISAGFPDGVKAASGGESSNFNRGRILAHDPEVWLAESVVPLQVEGLDEPEKGRKGKAKFPGNYLLGKLAVPQERNQWAFRTLLLKAAGYTQEAVEKWSSGGEKYEEGEIGSLWEQEPEGTEDEALASLNRLVVADARAAGDYVLEDREVLDDLAVVRTAMANRGADRDGEGAPKLFTTGGAVSRLANGGILQLEHLSLLDELGAQADWLRINGLGQMGKGTPCADALKIAVSADSARVGLTELNSIVHQPVVLPDGGGYTVVDMPGYREKAGVLSRVSGIESMELETAKAWLNDAFGFFETGANRPKEKTGFRFTDGQAASNGAACLFTPLLLHADRRIIAPMFAATKLTQTTGATTFLQAVASLSTGREMHGITWGQNVEELEKAIGALWQEGISTIFFDNVLEPAPCSLVSTLISEGYGATRKLGSSKMISTPGPPVLMMSANKTGIDEDYQTRVCQIDFDWGAPKRSDEDLSVAFRHNPYPLWLEENKAAVLSAMCAILRDALKRLPAVEPGKTRFPVWERWANAVLDSLGLLHIKVDSLVTRPV